MVQCQRDRLRLSRDKHLDELTACVNDIKLAITDPVNEANLSALADMLATLEGHHEKLDAESEMGEEEMERLGREAMQYHLRREEEQRQKTTQPRRQRAKRRTKKQAREQRRQDGEDDGHLHFASADHGAGNSDDFDVGFASGHEHLADFW